MMRKVSPAPAERGRAHDDQPTACDDNLGEQTTLEVDNWKPSNADSLRRKCWVSEREPGRRAEGGPPTKEAYFDASVSNPQKMRAPPIIMLITWPRKRARGG